MKPWHQAIRARRALLGLNFFMADMQAGIGPFLGVFLAAHGWRPGAIGTVMSLGGVAGMASGLLGWMFGFSAVFWLAAAFGVLSIIFVMSIPRDAVDHAAARGLEGEDEDEDEARPKGFQVLLARRPLLVLAACLALFHLGNGGMLPLYGLAVSQAGQGNPAALVALTVVVAQGTMVVMSVVATRMAAARGYWLVILLTFIALPVRGLIAATVITAWGVLPVQILDGVGAGLQSVAVPGLVARIMSGTGRVNVAQGAVMTVQGLGAALSPALGGWIAEGAGYPLAFACLGSLSLVSLGLWLAFGGLLRPACALQPAGAA
jgi:predicted MFS family arabinose efflux permease